jgi:hypothetical protein
MVNKIVKISKELGVNEKDIIQIKKKNGFVNKLIYWIISAIIAIISFILGYFVGKSSCLNHISAGYPFASGLVISSALKEKGKPKIMLLLLSTLAFLFAIKAHPVFGQAIKYNVYVREQRWTEK